MSVFDGYARYYNLLYRDKDYAAEARHVHDIIQKHASGARSILELRMRNRNPRYSFGCHGIFDPRCRPES